VIFPHEGLPRFIYGYLIMINSLASSVIVVNHDGLGHAETPLRHKLAANYFRTLHEIGQLPQAILFYADGVKLTTEGSPCLPELSALSANGVSLIVCRTCLDYYGLIEKVQIGDIGNMLRIVEAQAAAAKVITV
jgi:selenium metabolism protein YedF